MFFDDEKEENVMEVPYYEIIYFDDYNNKHYGKVKKDSDLLYMKERYDFLQCNFISQ